METSKTSDVMELKVELRKGIGKTVTRKLRRQGLIPGVFYGTRHEPVSVTLSPAEMVAALNTPKLKNTLIRLRSAEPELEGRTVLVKEIQRHPTNRALLHVDLVEVYPDLPVKALIPVLIQGIPKGIDFGGTLEQHLRYADIRCPADAIPASITIDVSELNIGDTIRLSQLVVGEGIELQDDPHTTVVSVVAPKLVAEAEVEAEAAPEEGAAAVEGAAAPAAAAAGEAGAKKAGEAGAKKPGEAGAKKEATKKESAKKEKA